MSHVCVCIMCVCVCVSVSVCMEGVRYDKVCDLMPMDLFQPFVESWGKKMPNGFYAPAFVYCLLSITAQWYGSVHTTGLLRELWGDQEAVCEDTQSLCLLFLICFFSLCHRNECSVATVSCDFLLFHVF